MERPFTVFISFVGDPDREFAEQLAQLITLENKSWKVFYDHESLHSGDDVSARIAEAIATSDVVVALVRPESVANEWVLIELGHAREHAVAVCPFKMTDATQPRHLADIDPGLGGLNLPEWQSDELARRFEIVQRLIALAKRRDIERRAAEADRVTLSIGQESTTCDRGDDAPRSFENEHLDLVQTTIDLFAGVDARDVQPDNLDWHLGNLLRRSVMGRDFCEQLQAERAAAESPLQIEIDETGGSNLDVPWELAAHWYDQPDARDVVVEAVVTRSRRKPVTGTATVQNELLVVAPSWGDDADQAVKPFLDTSLGEWVKAKWFPPENGPLKASGVPSIESSRESRSRATFGDLKTALGRTPKIVHLIARLGGKPGDPAIVFEPDDAEVATGISMVGTELANNRCQLLLLQTTWGRNPLDGYRRLRDTAAALADHVPSVIAFMTPAQEENPGLVFDREDTPSPPIERFIGTIYQELDDLARDGVPLRRPQVVSLVHSASQKLGRDRVGRLLPPIVYLGTDPVISSAPATQTTAVAPPSPSSSRSGRLDHGDGIIRREHR